MQATRKPRSVSLALGAVLALVAASLALASPSSAAVVTDTIGGMEFSANDANRTAGATLVSYTPGSLEVAIPASVEIDDETYVVTKIGDKAFYETGITKVTIPNDVTTIERLAFANNELTTVTIPNSVTTLGSGVFRENKLTSAVISNSLTTLPSQTFYVNELSTVTLPSNLTAIGNDAFARNSLASVTIPATVTSLGTNTFGENALSDPTLTDVTFLGPAPTTFSDTAAVEPSLGTGVGLTAHYPCVFHEDSAAGFTAPFWHGYASEGSTVIVTFQPSGTGPAIASQPVACAGTATEPAEDPTDEGRVFAGWYSNSDRIGLPFDFTTPLTENVTLYAAWEDVSAGEPGNGDEQPGDDDERIGSDTTDDSDTMSASNSTNIPAAGASVGMVPLIAALLALMLGFGLILTSRKHKP